PPGKIESRVGLVGAVTLHGIIVTQARKGERHVYAHQREELFHQALDDSKKLIDLRKSHFDVHLRELGLPIGAEILVAKASHDLEIAVETSDHQDLLEQLR